MFSVGLGCGENVSDPSDSPRDDEAAGGFAGAMNGGAGAGISTGGTGPGAGETDGGSQGHAGGGGGSEVAGAGSTGEGGGPGLTPRGAVSLKVQASENCSLEERFWDYPEMESDHPVTQAGVVAWLAQGDETANGAPVAVNCDFRGDAPPYWLRGQISIGAPAATPSTVELGSARLSLNEEAPGGFGFFEPEVGNPYGGTVEEPCRFEVLELDPETRSFTGRLTCAVLTDPERSDSCALGPSYFAFENCAP